jgi:hypothetical protein
MSKIGIKETEEALRWGLTTQDAITRANEDGKINWKDYPKFLPVLMQSGDALTGINKIKYELLDIDDAEQAQLVEITKEFYQDLTDEQRVDLITETIHYVIDGFQLALKWRDLGKVA